MMLVVIWSELYCLWNFRGSRRLHVSTVAWVGFGSDCQGSPNPSILTNKRARADLYLTSGRNTITLSSQNLPSK